MAEVLDCANRQVGDLPHHGKRLVEVRLPAPSATVQTFALSPNAGRLAVLAGSQISFYVIPAPVARNAAARTGGD